MSGNINLMNFPQDIIDRFWTKVSVLDGTWNFDLCWEWTAAFVDQDGYGRFAIEHNWPIASHRFSYMYYYGSIPKGMLVCHKCDNPPCVNPNHLFLGTNQDNLQDMSRKQRSTFGERSVHAKLTDNDVIFILESIRKGSIKTMTEIVDKYNLSRTVLRRLFERETWKHITNNYSDLESLYNKVKNKRGSKLSKVDVDNIRTEYNDGVNKKVLAALYEVDLKTIYNIVNYRTHV